MKPLLYLVHRIPYPPNKGDKIRSFHFLRALAENYQIFLGTFIDDSSDKQYVDALKPYCQESYCLDLEPIAGKIKSLQGFVSGEALSLPYYRNHKFQEWVDHTIATHRIERVLIFSSPMAQYVEKHAQLHRVADFVDVDSDKWRQYAASKGWPANWVYKREAEKLLKYETHIADQFDATVFVSEQEAQLFKTLAPCQADKIGSVNNGVDTDFFDPELISHSPFPVDQETVVFTGAMDYWANVDAVQWFAQQVLPLIKRENPAVRFYIVGSKPAKVVQQLAETDDAVILTGRVEDVRPYIAHAKVVVAPLRIARGIQNKVLEAMAMAKPVVVTPAGMEGISGGQGLQVAVTDNPDEFSKHVLSFLALPPTLALENRHYVRKDFSWQHNGQLLCELLDNGEL